MTMPLTIKELSLLRPFGADAFRRILADDPDAFDIYWELAKALQHPLLILEFWGWLVAARRQNRVAPGGSTI